MKCRFERYLSTEFSRDCEENFIKDSKSFSTLKKVLKDSIKNEKIFFNSNNDLEIIKS